MGDTILVTGGTGTLGRIVVEKLTGSGASTRVFSRHEAPGVAVGDLLTGIGLKAALAGVGTVVHCATGRKDPVQTANLIQAVQQGGSDARIVYISIVGVDRHPLFYYRAKFESEKLIVNSGLPYAILRATQFHNLVATMFTAQRGSPAILAPNIPMQPVDVREVADRLVELVRADAVGRASDFGGPEVRNLRDLAAVWLKATGRRRAVWPVSIPGKTFGAFASGVLLAPDHADGVATFEQFLASGSQGGVGGALGR